jgi:transcriptional regulator with XRE-family HTH domain
MTKVHEIWADAIERLRDRANQSEDISFAQLARSLGISPQKLADARNGRQELSSEVKAEILRRLGEPVSAEAFETFFPSKIRPDVLRLLEKVYEPTGKRKIRRDFWMRCLDDLKTLIKKNSETPSEHISDGQIAASLGISPSMISKARNGSGELSPVAKLKLLDRLGYMASADILCDLLPPKAAARLRELESLRFLRRGAKR